MRHYELARTFFFYTLTFSLLFLQSDFVFATTTSATSTFQIVATVLPPQEDPPPGGGGGGGGPVVIPPAPTEVSFSGRAFPNAPLTVLKDGQFSKTTLARPDGGFDILVSDLTAGTYLFSLSAIDIYGTQTDSITYSVIVLPAVRTTMSGIVLLPTIQASSLVVNPGDTVTIFGQTLYDSFVTIDMGGLGSTTVLSAANGVYGYTLNTTGIAEGQYTLKAKVKNTQWESGYTNGITLTVGEAPPETIFVIGDVNYDDKVNIVDFSISAFWYKRPLSAAFTVIEADRLNGDGKVDLKDFSLMAYHWTG